jgi:hypothetical protein
MPDKAMIIPGNTSLINRPDRRFCATVGGLKPSTTGGVTVGAIYSFSIIDLTTSTVLALPGLDPAKRTNGAIFQFPVSPRTYEVSEPSATTIQATQGGGKFVERHGSVFKDIRIAGTVGFRPSTPGTELIKGLSESTGHPKVSIPDPGGIFNDERGLTKKEITGFDDIIFLRNLFRAYGNITANAPGTSSRIAMVWTYAKEAESYVVEPVSFTTTRDASSPLSWTYNIQVRTLYAINQMFTAVKDPMNIFQVFNKGFQEFTKLGQSISRALSTLASVVDFFATLPFDIADSLIGASFDVLAGFAAIKNSFNFNKLKKDRVKQWKTAALDVLAQLETDGAGQAGRAGVARKVVRDMLRYANMTLSLDFLWEQSRQVQVEDYAAAYQDELGQDPITTGSPLNVANITLPDSGKEEEVLGGESIRDVALRLLGDAARWKELALLNDLKAPYVASVASAGVLGPGSKIIIPKEVEDIENENFVPKEVNQDGSTQSQSPILRQYGRDLKLTGTSSGQSDVGVNNRGDLDMIDGIPNVDQGMFIKFSTEQGELATHPLFGGAFPIGTKFPTLAKLQEFSFNTQRTIRQDPRVEDIEEIQTFAQGDQVLVNASAKLRGANIKLPINFSVRR